MTGCSFALEFLVWKMEYEKDRWTGWIAVVSPIIRVLYRKVEAKKELNQKAKLSIYQLIYALSFFCGHERWVVTKRMKLQIPSFLPKKELENVAREKNI